MISRRDVLKLSLLTGGAVAVSRCAPLRRRLGGGLGPSLDARTLPRFIDLLVIPPAMPPADTSGAFDYYEIAVRQFQQQVLPARFPATTVWGYGEVNHPGSFNFPSFTIEARVDRPSRIKWINGLVDEKGNYLPHLFAVDPSLHWANPEGPETDTRPAFQSTPKAYRGPVPIVTHVHGAHTTDESDGYAEAWFLPAAKDIDPYIRQGKWYETFRAKFKEKYGQDWEPGTSVSHYPNDQAATACWFHDHTLGMTRLNVYAGPTGFYFLRGGENDLEDGSLPGPAPAAGDPPGSKYYEIPLAIQDRSFNADGSLFYPDTREFFDEYQGDYIPKTDISPIWNPEFFGTVMLVNGKTWPRLEVEPRRYRFRLLNGCNSRFILLSLSQDLPMWQIGAEGGFLVRPFKVTRILMGPAERADVIVDFTGLSEGTEVILRNLGPDEPFKGLNQDGSLADGEGGSLPPADPETTGQVMKFVVGPLSGPDTSTPPEKLSLPVRFPFGPADRTRSVALLEEMSMDMEGEESVPVAAMLGTLSVSGQPAGLMWDDPLTEVINLDDVEVWEIHNFTADAHPIHIHEVMFEVVNRESMASGEARRAEFTESGLKDTVIAYPGEITRVKAKFDLPGRYVWHCHIVEHEDNEMMRPLEVR